MNAADRSARWRSLDQLVLKALVIPLLMIVRDTLREGPPEVAFAERNHPIETLLLNGAHEAFGVSIRIRRLQERWHDADPGVAEQAADVPTD